MLMVVCMEPTGWLRSVWYARTGGLLVFAKEAAKAPATNLSDSVLLGDITVCYPYASCDKLMM